MKMNNLIADFTKHISESLEIVSKTPKFSAVEVSNICIVGLGGSGIGGTLVSGIVSDTCELPITVSKGYDLPNFVNENTLVILSSYSGNTEETLNALVQAEERSTKICVISSGGSLLQIAKEKNYDYVAIPGGLPPRAAFGYSSVQVFAVLSNYNFISTSYISDLEKTIAFLNTEELEIQALSKLVANKLQGKLPVIYSEDSLEGVAVRFRQQINENAKMLCWHHVIPEMNHNELVGWTTQNDDLKVVVLRSKGENPRNTKRIEINKEIIEKYTNEILEIWAKGASKVEQAYYLVHFGDWVSYYLAELQEVDSIEVDVITHLKSSLAKM